MRIVYEVEWLEAKEESAHDGQPLVSPPALGLHSAGFCSQFPLNISCLFQSFHWTLKQIIK